jgi:glycosyltransferase involved in cell wall biosynthesis
MKVLYDHQAFSLQDAGGASRYHFELAQQLSSVPDVSLSIYLGLNSSVYPFAAIRDNGTHIIGWNTSVGPGLTRYALNEVFTGTATMFKSKCDIYHPTLYRRMPFIRSRKLVATHHDCTHERFPELFDDTSRIVSAKRRLYAAADSIICISESSRNDLFIFYKVGREKTRVIHNGVTRLVRRPERAKQFIHRLRRPYLLFVGGRHSYKNFAALLEAYHSLALKTDYDLILLGGGKLTQKELQAIERMNLAGHILHDPLVDDNLLAEAYTRAELLVYPSLYEGFGLPPLEAMSLGCRVVAARTSSIPEVCKDAVFYFDPAIPGSLDESIRCALADDEREARVRRGIEVASDYSWSKCAAKTLDLYRSL